MKFRIHLLLLFMLSAFISCRNKSIISMLESPDHSERIEGAYRAGKTGNKKYVPYLLKDAYDFAMTTRLKFKGISVYQAKMEALSDIYKIKPPIPITYKPDSSVIRFYTGLYENEQ